MTTLSLKQTSAQKSHILENKIVMYLMGNNMSKTQLTNTLTTQGHTQNQIDTAINNLKTRGKINEK